MDLVSQQVLFKQSVLALHLKEAFKGLCALELGLRGFSMAVRYHRGKPFSTHRAGLAVLGSLTSTSTPVCWEDHRLPRHLSAKKLQGPPSARGCVCGVCACVCVRVAHGCPGRLAGGWGPWCCQRASDPMYYKVHFISVPERMVRSLESVDIL